LEAQAAAPSVCFIGAVEMARLIRAKKLSAREALAAHLKQIERVNPKVMPFAIESRLIIPLATSF
jgi:amidase